MDKGQLNLKQFNTDEDQFEKLRCMHQHELFKKLMEEFCMGKGMKQINAEVRKLRKGMNKLQKLKIELCCCQKPDDIEELPFNISNSCDDDISSVEVDDEEEKQELQLLEEEELMISCGSTPCLFEDCRKRVDNQLLLLHYYTNHSDGDAAFLRCHKIGRDQQIVLSFTARRCVLNQNQVIGLLDYGDSHLEQKQLPSQPCHQIYNCFQHQENVDSEGNVPIVVLICKTSPSCRLMDKLRYANPKDQVFVLWLVTTHAQSKLNATLCLCGRNAAVQAKAILAVRSLSEGQNTSEFMIVDGNYWRLSYNEIRKISNGFRDELHLTVGINQ